MELTYVSTCTDNTRASFQRNNWVLIIRASDNIAISETFQLPDKFDVNFIQSPAIMLLDSRAVKFS